MRLKNSIKSIVSGALAAVMTLSALPTINVQAAQVNEYIDPADVWITSNGRTNELDFNATITQETSYCPVCNKDTIMLTYRTPEYTKSGTTALNRGVMYSDGTMTDGVTKGNVDDGRPGVDALICGGIGSGAQNALLQAGIKLYGGVSGSADEAAKALASGTLEFNPDVQCGHHGHHGHGVGHSCGGHGCH